MEKTAVVVAGAQNFKKFAKPARRSFFRPTGMSVAMAEGGVIPGLHMVKELAATALVRNKNDQNNTRRSVFIAL